MDDFLGTLLYIVITVGLIIASALRKTRKNAHTPPLPPSNNPQKQKERGSLSSLWEELLEEEVVEQPADIKDQPNAYEERVISTKTPTAQQTDKQQVHTQSLSNDVRKKNKKKMVKPDVKSSIGFDLGKELRKKGELRKAIIYNEIIKPKHF